MESTITDALSIISAVIIIQLISASAGGAIVGAGDVLTLLMSSFTYAIVLGVIFAALWIAAIVRFSVSSYAYIISAVVEGSMGPLCQELLS